MWLPRDIILEVEAVARITYIDAVQTARWNKYRQPGELRLLTGWAWIARNGRDSRQGFKTQTVAFRDAYYALCRREEAPAFERRRVRLIQGGKTKAAA